MEILVIPIDYLCWASVADTLVHYKRHSRWQLSHGPGSDVRHTRLFGWPVLSMWLLIKFYPHPSQITLSQIFARHLSIDVYHFMWNVSSSCINLNNSLFSGILLLRNLWAYIHCSRTLDWHLLLQNPRFPYLSFSSYQHCLVSV